MGVISADDTRHELVAHDIGRGKAGDTDTLDTIQHVQRIDRLFPIITFV